MQGRFFLDTNVFVYAFDPTDPAKAGLADSLIHRAFSSREGVISFQVVQEFLNVGLRARLPIADIRSFLQTVLVPLLGIHSSTELYSEALEIQQRYKISWYDSLIVAAALKAGCETLYSEDLSHGQRFEGLLVENPFR
jgi:predicted nucleic acid-binding protein